MGGWINLETIKALTNHGINSVYSIAIAAGYRYAVFYLLSPGDFRDWLVYTDDLVVAGIFVWLVREMAVTLWNDRERFRFHVFLLA
jgi:hypothetical protein